MLLLATTLLATPADAPEPRLPATVHPVRYSMTLDVDPAVPTFSGQEDIALKLDEPTAQLHLHGVGLTVLSATARQGKRKPVKLKTAQEGNELVFTARRPLAAGAWTLHVSWKGNLDTAPLKGLYRFKAADQWYVGSQFEATDARRMAPCFDEPAFKVPWQLSLRIPDKLVAVSNGKIVRTRKQGKRVQVDFAVTRPLPSYLWAVLVGPFDVVEAGNVGKAPVRVLVPKGRAALASYAAKMAVSIQTWLESYFGIPLPYGKMDHVVLAEFGSGGMENAGAITYREEALLMDEAHAPVAARRRVVGILAHELAHQWFGDLVTMKWWDDLWLNEAFASWMGRKASDALAPELEVLVERLGGHSHARFLDALPSTHPVHVPVDSATRAREVFDTITYIKGSAVLDMLEAWLGPDNFRKGVNAYLAKHADGNAEDQDLYTALAAASGIPNVTAVANAWFSKPYHPLVVAERICTNGKPPAVRLRQEQYAISGTPAEDTARPTPVCVAYDNGGKRAQACTLLAPKGQQDLALPTDKGACPSWVMPNAGIQGFYTWRLTSDITALARAPLNEVERAGVIDNAWTLLRLGHLGVADFTRMLDAMAQDPSRHVAIRVASRWEYLAEPIADAKDTLVIRAHIGGLFGARAQALGWENAPNDSEGTRELRARLLSVMALLAEDPAWTAQAKELTAKWLKEPASVSPEAARVAVSAAAAGWSQADVDSARSMLTANPDPERRVLLVLAMGSPLSPKVLQSSLRLFHDPLIRQQDLFTLVWPAFRDNRVRPTAWAWLKQDWEGIRKRIDEDRIMYAPMLMSGACSQQERDDVNTFFTSSKTALPGTGARLKETLDQVDACVTMRNRLQVELHKVVVSWAQAGGAAGQHRATSKKH